MGRKVNPNAIRMGINKIWDAVWYADKAQFPKIFAQDLKIEEKIRKTCLEKYGVEHASQNKDIKEKIKETC